MTIEQKAKAFDEALEMARKELQACGSTDCDATRQIFRFFPELKESEDENWIPKEIIKYLKEKGDFRSCWLAWLEKQGEKQIPQSNERAWLYLVADVLTWREGIGQYLDNSKVQELAKKLQKEYGQKLYIEEQGNPTGINPSEFDLRLNKLLKQFETLPKEELVSSLSFYLNVVQNDGTYKEEKQGEQKPIDKIQLGKRYKCTASPRYSTFMEGEIYEPKDKFLCSLMNFCSDCFESIEDNEQKPNDKVEPKFKVNDWILYSGDHYKGVRHITKINENGYYIERNGLPHGIIPFNHEICMRLWTIQDAKDGDVLQLGKVTAIFQKYIGNGNCMCHCSVYEGEFKIPSQDGDDNSYGCHDAIPATKEQRNLLFKKMKEAGYKWDAERKKVEKIEQKPADKLELKKVEDEEYNGDDYGIDSLWHAKNILEETLGKVDGYQTDDGILEHKCAISAVNKLYEHKFDWSEEDEIRIKNILSVLDVQVCWDGATGKKGNPYQKDIDWLKSLKPQNHWKPTEPQLVSLTIACNRNDRIGFDLTQLLKELKKL